MQKIILMVFAAAVFGTALQLVTTRHESRKAFAELEELGKHHDRMMEEWGRLQLEEATWGTHGRVEELARAELDMTRPEINRIVLVMP